METRNLYYAGDRTATTSALRHTEAPSLRISWKSTNRRELRKRLTQRNKGRKECGGQTYTAAQRTDRPPW